jgi:hypothetical protein
MTLSANRQQRSGANEMDLERICRRLIEVWHTQESTEEKQLDVIPIEIRTKYLSYIRIWRVIV